MILYGVSLFPFVTKTLVYIGEKGIQIDHKPLWPGSKKPEFRAASPFGLIPAFTDGDYALADSSAIIAYLEALYPTPCLIPLAPQPRGRAIWFEEFADTILMPVMRKIFFNRIVKPKIMKEPGNLAEADHAEQHELPPLLTYIETSLQNHDFLVGDTVTLADIAVASPFIGAAYAGFTPDPQTFPHLARFLQKMHTRPATAALISSDRAALEI